MVEWMLYILEQGQVNTVQSVCITGLMVVSFAAGWRWCKVWEKSKKEQHRG